jgi:hypothetical protein
MSTIKFIFCLSSLLWDGFQILLLIVLKTFLENKVYFCNWIW